VEVGARADGEEEDEEEGLEVEKRGLGWDTLVRVCKSRGGGEGGGTIMAIIGGFKHRKFEFCELGFYLGLEIEVGTSWWSCEDAWHQCRCWKIVEVRLVEGAVCACLPRRDRHCGASVRAGRGSAFLEIHSFTLHRYYSPSPSGRLSLPSPYPQDTWLALPFHQSSSIRSAIERQRRSAGKALVRTCSSARIGADSGNARLET
jgi:hypothetical protein